MAAELKPYVVQQGDTLTKLSSMRSFIAGEVWEDEKNADLRKRRPDMDVLAPGDVIYLPDPQKSWLPIAKGATNRYVATVPKVTVHVVLQDEDGKPLSDTPCVIRGLGDPIARRTEADGGLSIEVPVLAREIAVELPDRGLVYPVRVGDLDPIEERSGVAMRLVHLGYLPGLDAGDPAAVERAIAAFQSAQGIEPTGALDDATRAALETAHGS